MALFAELRAPCSSDSVRVTDATFSGVQARVFESTVPGPWRLRRGVVYFHGGGWALGSAREWKSLKSAPEWPGLFYKKKNQVTLKC